eukprot:COSAG01_NODE_1825_length_9137_cov_246.763886_2_plen_89_part_00
MIPRRALSLWETMQTLQKTHILLYEKIQNPRVSLVKPGMRGANKRGFNKKSLGQHCTVLLPLLFRFRDSYSTSTRSRAELLVASRDPY